MADRLDVVVKIAILASVLVASSSAGYHYFIYMPRRDAQLDVARKAEAERAKLQRAEEQQRLLSEKMRADDEKRAEQERAEARARARLPRD